MNPEKKAIDVTAYMGKAVLEIAKRRIAELTTALAMLVDAVEHPDRPDAFLKVALETAKEALNK